MTINAALSGGDVTALRSASGTQRVTRGYISVIPSETVATARIDQTVFSDTLAQLTVDNTSDWGDVQDGMSVWVGTTAGARDVGVYRVRGIPASDTLYIGETSTGDPGKLAVDDLLTFADDQYITIKDDENIDAIFPRILYTSPDNYSFLKNYDVAYTSQNETAIAAPVNIGIHFAGFADPVSGTIDYSFVPEFLDFDGATVSAVLWTGIDTFIAGNSTTANVTARFSPGHYVVRLQVTRSNGSVVTVRRHIRIHDDNDPPIEVEVTSFRMDQDGARVSINLVNPEDVSEFLTGSLVIFWFDAEWNGQVIGTASTHFAGFIMNIQGESSPGIFNNRFEIMSPLLAVDNIRAYSQILSYSASPSNWQEAIESLMHLDYFLFYLLYYHSNLLHLFDIVLPGETAYTSNSWSVDPGSILSQLQTAAKRRRCHVGQSSDGTIWVMPDPLDLYDDTERDAVPERFTVTGDDAAQVRHEWRLRPEYGAVTGYAFGSGVGVPDAYHAIAAGTVAGQGANEETMENMLAEEAELPDIVANRLARLNNPLGSITITLTRAYLIFEPACLYWVRLTLAADEWSGGYALDVRIQLQSVDIEFARDGIVHVTIIGEPETAGYNAPAQSIPVIVDDDIDADLLPIPTFDANGLVIPPWDPTGGYGRLGYPGIFGLPAFGGLDVIGGGAPIGPDPDLVSVLIAWSTDMGFAANFPNAGISFSEIFTTDNVIDIAKDPASPLSQGTGDQLTLHILTDVGIHFGDEALQIGASYPQIDTFTGSFFLRKIAAKTNGAVAIGEDISSGTWAYTLDFRNEEELELFFYAPYDGDPTGSTVDYDDPLGYIDWLTDEGSNYQEYGLDFPDSSNVLWQRRAAAWRYVGDVTITRLRFVHTHTPGTGSHGYLAAVIKTDDSTVNYTAGSTTGSEIDDDVTLSTANVNYIRLHDQAGQTQIPYPGSPSIGGDAIIHETTIEGSGHDPFSDNVWVRYTEDNWDNITYLSVGLTNQLDRGMDIMDYDPGVIVAAAGWGLYSNSGYATDDFAAIPNSDIPKKDENHYITFVRIPFRTVDNAGANSSTSSLDVVYGMWGEVQGQTTWVIHLNTSTRAYTYDDITPIISSVTYCVVPGGHAFEASGSDSSRFLAIAEPLGGGDRKLIRSSNGGTSWQIMQSSFNFDRVHFLDDSDQIAVFSGEDGFAYTSDFGVTVTVRNTDFEANVSGFPARGAFLA